MKDAKIKDKTSIREKDNEVKNLKRKRGKGKKKEAKTKNIATMHANLSEDLAILHILVFIYYSFGVNKLRSFRVYSHFWLLAFSLWDVTLITTPEITDIWRFCGSDSEQHLKLILSPFLCCHTWFWRIILLYLSFFIWGVMVLETYVWNSFPQTPATFCPLMQSLQPTDF